MHPVKSISIGLTVAPGSALSGFGGELESLVTVMEDIVQSDVPVIREDAFAVMEYSTSPAAGVE